MTMQAPDVQTLLKKIQSLPADRVAEVEDFVDFLREQVVGKVEVDRELLDFPVDDLGPWPEALLLHREDWYGDDGR